MKTICLISPGILPIPNIYGGAIETLISTFIQENEKYHKVKLIVFSRYNFKAKKLSKKYNHTKIFYIRKPLLDRWYSAIVHRLKKYANIELPFSSWYYYKTYLYLKKINPDYIVAEGGKYIEFKKISNYFGKEKVYLHLHHHLLPNNDLDNIFDNIIGVSSFISNDWRVHSVNPNGQSHVVYNCIDEEKFNITITKQEKYNIRKKMKFSSNDFVVIFCGRIIEEKGIKELIKALNLIKESHIKLLIIGSPNFALDTKSDYLREVEHLIKMTENKIIFTGYIPNEKLNQYYQIADVQVIPSIWQEAAGLVAIEGMQSGLPLIITKSGGMVEYVSQQCSLQLNIDEKLVENIAKSILSLYNDSKLCDRMHKESIKQAKRFSKSKFYFDILNILNRNE